MSYRIWISTLVNYFTTIKEVDSQIEEIRLSLCENKNFIPKALFDSIDLDHKNYITLNDLKIYLNNHYLNFEEQCLRRLIHNFDKDKDFSINYQEFLGLILTKSNSSLANNVSNSFISNEDYKIDTSIEIAFIKLLELELNLVKTLSQIADEIKYSSNFTTYEAFLAITKNEKYITVDNLGEFLKDYKINIDSYGPFNLMCRLDADGDGKISYEEFIDLFFPYKENYSPSDTQIKKEESNNYTINDASNSNINLNQNTFNISNNSTFPNQMNNIQDNPYNNGEDVNSTFKMIKSTRLKNRNPNNNIIRNNYYRKAESSNYNLNSPKQNLFSNNPCNTIQTITHSPLGFDYKKGLNKKPRNSSMDNTFRSTFDNSYNQQSYKNINYNISSSINQFKNNYSPMKNDLNNSNSFNSESYNNDNIYMNKLRTYSSPNKNNSIYLNNTYNEGYFTRSPKYSPIRTNIIKSPRINLPKLNNNYCNNLNQTENALTDLLCDIITQENNIENCKTNLAYCNDANLTDLFQFFDYSQRNGISPIDLIQSLKEVGLFITNEDANIIFQKYDNNADGILDYEEFCDMILPKKFTDAKLLSEKYPPNSFNGFSPDTKNKISNVFTSIINGEKSIDNYRKQLTCLPCFSPYDLFNMINRNSCPGIYKEDLVYLLEKNCIFLKPFETEILIDRFEKNQDGVINYNEFTEEISPKL